MCLTRLQPLLHADSPIHHHLFWVAISVLQLDEVALYAAGLALLEQNLHTLDNIGLFDNKVIMLASTLAHSFLSCDYNVHSLVTVGLGQQSIAQVQITSLLNRKIHSSGSCTKCH